MTTPPADAHDDPDPAAELDPAALRLRAGLRVEVLDDEALALDPTEGVVHRLEGAAARIVADLRTGRVPDLTDAHDHDVVEALIAARIVEA